MQPFLSSPHIRTNLIQHTNALTPYPHSVRIKRTVDPDDVLWCNPCVGNDRWQEIDGQLCRLG